MMKIGEAIEKAKSRGLDLVEVAPKNEPSVCKIMDYGTYIYEQKKKTKKNKKTQKQTEIKTIRLSIRTEIHDLEVKAKQARKFLNARHIVKVVIIFRGREMAHEDLGIEKMGKFQEMLSDIATTEQNPKKQGYQMIMVLNPIK